MAPNDADYVTDAPVAIVSAGPAGLMLAHLLGRAGVEALAIDTHTRIESETTHRAGILEADSARHLVETGVAFRSKDESALNGYQPQALQRAWRAQNFSHWMTHLLHVSPATSTFDIRRQIGERLMSRHASRSDLPRRAVHRVAHPAVPDLLRTPS